MSMSLSFASAVSPAAIQPPATRSLPERLDPSQPTEPSASKAPAATLSQNSLNAQNLLNTRDTRSAATEGGLYDGVTG